MLDSMRSNKGDSCDSIARLCNEAAAAGGRHISARGADIIGADVIVKAVPVLLRVPEAPGTLRHNALAVADSVLQIRI